MEPATKSGTPQSLPRMNTDERVSTERINFLALDMFRKTSSFRIQVPKRDCWERCACQTRGSTVQMRVNVLTVPVIPAPSKLALSTVSTERVFVYSRKHTRKLPRSNKQR